MQRKSMSRRVAVCVLALAPLLAAAHPARPVPDCAEPVRPADKKDAVVWNRFVDQVDVYRSCMNAFIQDNHAAAERHRAAANAATEQWNAFVHGSLNVPEDFPWPPEDR